MLNTRLASVESMTHDVIRDLLGVKLDITNYAVSFCPALPMSVENCFLQLHELFYFTFQDLVSQNQLQKFVQEAQQQARQYITMVY